ncbi:MAG: cbb3-type cytochrome c oxidase subunit I [Thermoproteus sp.]
MPNGKSIWPAVILAATILVYVAYALMAYYTFTHIPPIPDEVVTANGAVLFTGNDVVMGKYYFQKYGLMDYGSVLGMGAYYGIDFTSYTLRILEDSAAHGLGFSSVPQGNATAMAAIKAQLTPKLDGNNVVVSDAFARGFHEAVDYYAQMLGPNSSQYRLKPDLILNRSVVKDLTAYFTWTALIALENWTNGFPYMPGLLAPTNNVIYASWGMIIAILLTVMPMAAYIVVKFLDYWHDPRTPIQLPQPDGTQRLTLWGFALFGLALGVQGLLGGYVMHLYTEPSLYGVDLLSILPYNVARALHYNLAILWIVLTWLTFSLFVFPYFGVKLTKTQVVAVLALGVAVALGDLFGIWLSYLGYIPSPWWFIVGSQGRDVIDQGTLWLLLLTAALGYFSYLWYRASKSAADPLKPFAKILSIAIAGAAAGTFIGALPVVAPWPDFQVDEYFRWMTIHAYVEGFWPPIVVTVVAVLLFIAGLVPQRLALAVVGLDATSEIVTGMIGTAHHYYFTGLPTFWMYVGAIVSVLEAVPLGFMIIYAIVIWRRGGAKTELQKTLLTYALVAGIGGGIGVVVLGAAFINAPALNYFLHDAQSTMAHAHAAFPLAYGVPSILMWVAAFYLSGKFSDRDLRFMRWAAVIIGVGFYLQVLLTLEPLAVLQMQQELSQGYWFIKTLYTPSGAPGFWQEPVVIDVIWLRMLGDLVAGAGFAIVIFGMLARLLKR